MLGNVFIYPIDCLWLQVPNKNIFGSLTMLFSSITRVLRTCQLWYKVQSPSKVVKFSMCRKECWYFGAAAGLDGFQTQVSQSRCYTPIKKGAGILETGCMQIDQMHESMNDVNQALNFFFFLKMIIHVKERQRRDTRYVHLL